MNQQRETISSPALEAAWQRYAEFNHNALAVAQQRQKLQYVAVAAAVLAVLLAMLTGSFVLSAIIPDLIREIFSAMLILVVIVLFTIFLVAARVPLETNAELRAAAEAVKKEIYLYRTILQWHDDRDTWLSEQIIKIQRRVTNNLGSEKLSKPYHGPIPPNYDQTEPSSDAGFMRLWPDGYIRYRLDNQLLQYTADLQLPRQMKMVLHVSLLITAGLSLLLAALGVTLHPEFNIWVPAAIFAAAALVGWLEPRRLDEKISRYNRLIVGLTTIKDYWNSLNKEEQHGEAFFKLVISTEKVIWSQYNTHESEMWQAIDELRGQPADALDEALMLPANAILVEEPPPDQKAPVTPSEVITGEIVTVTENGSSRKNGRRNAPVAAVEPPGHRPSKGLPHAFVVMPFGRKQGPDGRWLDFDAIYYDLIRPSLEAAGFESFRADEESVSGDILTDMFQELLLADLVIADLSIDNANVFYELGVRHAMRKRGVVHIQSGRAYMPFDIFNVRTIPYHIDKNGRPDPEHLERDKQAITKITRETWASDLNRIHSPIFNLLDGLVEPDRKTLRTPLATGFWREYIEWKERVTIAQRQKRIGDILLLTEEISNPLIKEEAISEAGKALQGMGRHALALQQYRHGLVLSPKNSDFRRQEAFHLNRLNRTDEAIVKLESLLQDNANDTEAISYLGRIYKQMWMETWVDIEDDEKRLQEAFNSSHWLIKSIHAYLQGYSINQNDYYPGINALTGSVLMDYLAEKFVLEDDPDINDLRQFLPKLKGAIHFSLESTTKRNTSDYWALVSLAELEVNIADHPQSVTRAYRKALTAARKNVSSLRSSLGQLKLLRSLKFRPEFVSAGIDVLQGEINRIKSKDKIEDTRDSQTPSHVFLYSGHPLDYPNQPEPCFPAAMEKEVRERIEQALKKFEADHNDLGITYGAAAGGDIIFLESCLKREMKVEILLPFEEARYIKEAISYAGDSWIQRFYLLRNNPNVTIRLQADHLGPVKANDNIYERNERWALYTSLVHGIDQVRLIVLWNGLVDEIPGGPDDMLEQVRQMGGIAEHLNPTKFDYWKAGGKVSKALDSLTQGL